MKNNIERFEEELNSIIGICDEKIERYRALLEEYQMIRLKPPSMVSSNPSIPDLTLSAKLEKPL
jgi:hypothetical protein